RNGLSVQEAEHEPRRISRQEISPPEFREKLHGGIGGGAISRVFEESLIAATQARVPRRRRLFALLGPLLGAHLEFLCDPVLTAVDAHASDAMTAQEGSDGPRPADELEKYIRGGIVAVTHGRFEKLPDSKALLGAAKIGGDLAAAGSHEIRACDPDCPVKGENSPITL